MSTAQLEANAWVQTENTLDAAQAWAFLEQAAQLETDCAAAAAPEQPIQHAAEPAPSLPEDFWQDWFGIWR